MIDSFFKDKRVSITGGAGFIGSAIARRLANLCEVTIVDSLTPEFGGNLKNLEEVKSKVIKMTNFIHLKLLPKTGKDLKN